MLGLFFAYNVGVNELMQNYVPISAALSPEKILPSVDAAIDNFIRPVLGNDLADHIISLSEKQEPSNVEKMVLDSTRRAALNLALWYNFQELNTHLTDQGWKREEGENYKSLYHYQEEELKLVYRNKGYNALDSLLELLQAGVSTFNLYENSPAYVNKMSSIVRGAEEVEHYFILNSSTLVFMAMRPIINLVYENTLRLCIGSKAQELLDDYLKSGCTDSVESLNVMGRFREYASSYVIVNALARMMEQYGTLTDRGLYYKTLQAADKSIVEVTPVDLNERQRLATRFRMDGRCYKGRLLNFIERNLPAYFVGRPEKAFNRDNDNKHTFFA